MFCEIGPKVTYLSSMYMYYDDIETSAESSVAAVCCCATPVFAPTCSSISVRWLGGCLDCFVEWLVSWFVSLWLVCGWFMVGW